MRILTILLCMVGTLGFAHAPLSGIYTLQTQDKHVDCDIYLFKNGFYNVVFNEFETNDIVFVTILSYGNFVVKQNRIVFTDMAHRYTMEMEINDNEIVVKRSFYFLKNSKFIFYSENHESLPTELYSLVNVQKLKQERQNYQRLHKDLFALDSGTYKSNELEHPHLLHIRLPNQYQLEYKDIVMSKGTWRRVGNELILFDTELKCSFYALIGDKIIISKLVVGDYLEHVFKKQ